MAAAVALSTRMVAGGADVPGLATGPGPLRAEVGSPRTVSLPGGERRVVRRVALETGNAGTASFTLSEPAGGDPPGPLPVVLILAGFRTGEEALRLVPEHGDALLAAYEYPYSAERWESEPKWSQVFAARRAILRVPAQVAAIRAWLRRSGRADGDRSALLGFSFGAVFAPAAQAAAADAGEPFRAVGLAYGGADIERMVRRSLDLGPSWLNAAAARAVSAAVSAIEPARHLPGLPGHFLLVHGRGDRRIPAASSELLTRLTPRPRRVVRLDSGHLHPSRGALLRRLGALSRAWLAEAGVLPQAPSAAAGGGDDPGRAPPPGGTGNVAPRRENYQPQASPPDQTGSRR